MNTLNIYSIILVMILSMFLCCNSRNSSIVVNFDGSSKNKWAIEELNPELPKDWSNYEFLTFDIYATSPQRFSLVLHDKTGERRITILPFQNAWVRVSITFKVSEK